MPVILGLALAAGWLPPAGWSGPIDQPRQIAGRRAPSPWLASDGRTATGQVSGMRGQIPWLATDGQTTAIGHGRRVAIHDRGAAASQVEILLDVAGVSGALVGQSLLILDEDGALLHLDLHDPSAAVVDRLPAHAARPASLAAMGGTLVVVDQARGLELLAISPLPHRDQNGDQNVDQDGGHHGGPQPGRLRFEPARSGFIPLTEPLTALAAQDDRAVVARGDGTLVILPFDPASAGRRHIVLGEPVRSLAMSSGRIYALLSSGVVRIDLLEGEDPPRPIPIARVTGTALAVVGREVSVLSEDAKLTRVIDDAPAALLHTVSVLNNFFSPNALTILPGDTVRWSNNSGFHNVFSCTVSQFGCTTDAKEEFTSGEPGNLWISTHTFQQPGENAYVCQPHAGFMGGTVTVATPPPAPPPVPDGRDGSPMTVTPLDPNANALSIAWDDTSCGTASSYHLIWGNRAHLPAVPGGAFALGGAVCGIATPFTWSSPVVALRSFIWWLILPDEGTTEGSWGVNALGAERVGPAAGGSSGVCSIVSKDVSAGCNP